MVKAKKQRILKKKTVLLLVGLVLLIVAGVGYILVSSYQQASNRVQTPATPEEKVSEIVQTVETGKDPKAAQKELQQLADKEPDTDKKVIYLSGAADLSFHSSDFKTALTISESIEALQQSALSAASIAAAYSEQGDYKNAVKYYDLAVSRSEKPTSETERAPYNDYMILKREAEAKIQ